MALFLQDTLSAHRHVSQQRCFLAISTSALATCLIVLAGCNAKPGGADSNSKTSSPTLLAIGANADAQTQSTNNNDATTNSGQNGQTTPQTPPGNQPSAGAGSDASKPAADAEEKIDDETKATVKLFQENMHAFDAGKPYDFKPVAKQLADQVQRDFTPLHIRLATEASNSFIDIGQYDLAKQLLTALGQAAAKSDNAEITSEITEFIKPLLAKLNLLGTKPTIEGAVLGGDKLDWARYKGKVVLLDFWATWCGPCRAELPNVKQAYEKYHDQGFDVIGISLDDDKVKLIDFLEKEQLPWPILFSDDPAKQGWEARR